MEKLTLTRRRKSSRKIELIHAAELVIYDAITAGGARHIDNKRLPDGWFTISYQELTQLTNLSKDQISRAVKRLAKHGYMLLAAPFDRCGHRRKTLFGVAKNQLGSPCIWSDTVSKEAIMRFAKDNDIPIKPYEKQRSENMGKKGDIATGSAPVNKGVMTKKEKIARGWLQNSSKPSNSDGEKEPISQPPRAPVSKGLMTKKSKLTRRINNTLNTPYILEGNNTSNICVALKDTQPLSPEGEAEVHEKNARVEKSITGDHNSHDDASNAKEENGQDTKRARVAMWEFLHKNKLEFSPENIRTIKNEKDKRTITPSNFHSVNGRSLAQYSGGHVFSNGFDTYAKQIYGDTFTAKTVIERAIRLCRENGIIVYEAGTPPAKCKSEKGIKTDVYKSAVVLAGPIVYKENRSAFTAPNLFAEEIA